MRSLLKDNNGFQWAILAVAGALTTLVGIIIGVMVWYKTNTALFSAAEPTGHGLVGLNTIFNATNATANTVWSLAPVVALVLIAGVILAVIMGFGRAQ